MVKKKIAELQISGCTENNSKILVLFLSKNICCDPSLQFVFKDVFNDGSQQRFLWKIIPKLSPLHTTYLVAPHYGAEMHSNICFQSKTTTTDRMHLHSELYVQLKFSTQLFTQVAD